MDEPLIGEIRAIAFNYAPKNWALCNGQLLNISQNQALFSVLGTSYGGNGTTTFALPNLQSRVPVGIGQLAGGSNYVLGQQSGQESITLMQGQLGAHNHAIIGTLQAASGNDEATPAGDYPGGGNLAMYASGPRNSTMGAIAPGMTGAQGGNTGHENRMPYLATYYVIALVGIYPTRG